MINTTTVEITQPYYRITSLDFYSSRVPDHYKVVDGNGAKRSVIGARYNFPGVTPTVYLAEDLETCLAEKMFYFQREILEMLDRLHTTAHHRYPPPVLTKAYALWEIVFKNPIDNVIDLTLDTARSNVGMFTCMITNPSQDYYHLKQKRAEIEATGLYKGLRAQSSRSLNNGNMVVLFESQSRNIQSIKAYRADFRMITNGGSEFSSHAQEEPDFSSGMVTLERILAPGSPAPGPPLPTIMAPYELIPARLGGPGRPGGIVNFNH